MTLSFTFGDDKDAKIEYDENGTNAIQVTGANWTYQTQVNITGNNGLEVGNIGISPMLLQLEQVVVMNFILIHIPMD